MSLPYLKIKFIAKGHSLRGVPFLLLQRIFLDISLFFQTIKLLISEYRTVFPGYKSVYF